MRKIFPQVITDAAASDGKEAAALRKRPAMAPVRTMAGKLGPIWMAVLLTLVLSVHPSVKAAISAEASCQDGGIEMTISSDRQTVVSLGETAETVFISWKGGRDGPRFIRISQSMEGLPRSGAVEGSRVRALGGAYFRYTARLEGLERGTTYYYEIGDGVVFDSPASFRTPKESGEDVFLYLGDVQFDLSLDEYRRWGEDVEAIYDRHPDLEWAVIGGDMVNVPWAPEQWNGFLENCRTFSSLPLMTVPGNHEGVKGNSTYRKMFSSPANGPFSSEDPVGDDKAAAAGDFYYFDCGNCRFIMTDSSFLTEARKESLGLQKWNQAERAVEVWLAEALEESPGTWNIVVTHHPPYGMHDKNTVSPELRELWVPIMEEYGADLVLCGHQHMYMRTECINGILYVMGNSGQRKSGFFNGSNVPGYSASAYGEGMSYQIIQANWKELKITSYNEKGLIVDETLLEKNVFLHVLEFFGSH